MSSTVNPDRWRAAGNCLQISGHHVFYRDTGEPKPALVLLHGFPTSSWDWQPIWDDLKSRYRVIALDFPGFGYSSRPQKHRYSIAEQADVTIWLLVSLNVTDVHVLSHDYGDTVAQELLARQCDKTDEAIHIRSVCFLNGGLFPETHRPRLIQTLLRTPIGPFLGRLYNQQKFARSFSAVSGMNTQPGSTEIEHFWQVVSHNDEKKVLHKLLHDIPERTKFRSRWVGALNNVGIPLRLICGLDDPVSGAHMATPSRKNSRRNHP